MTWLRRTMIALTLLFGCAAARAEGVAPFVDVLAWQVSQETSSTWASVFANDSFTAANLQFDVSAGLRTGLMFKPDNPWDFRAYWTYLPAAQSAELAPTNGLVVPEFFSGFLSGDDFAFTRAAIDWRLDFHTFDFEAGHEIALTDAFSIRPSLGLKGAVINQSIQTRLADPLLGISAEESIDHDYYGMGPSFGIDVRWLVPKLQGLSLTASLSGAFLYGVWNVEDSYRRTDAQPPIFTFGAVETRMNDDALGTPMLRYYVGVEWTRPGAITTTFHAGFEAQWWANQLRAPTFQQLPLHGDLTLQGATCGLSFCF